MDLQQSVRQESLSARVRSLRSGDISWRMFKPGAVFSAFRMIFSLYPRRFRADRALQDEVLRSFVLTVIPGAKPEDPNLIRMYHDRDYPFYAYTAYLVSDLVHRSARRCGSEDFALLGAKERTAVIEQALASNETTSRLYRGAILMAQVSYFAGIYDPDGGCALIDFPGRNGGYSLKEISYPNAIRYLGGEMTLEGNPP